MMSSERFLAPDMSFRSSNIVFWNISATAMTPNSSLLYLLRPTCVINVVIYLIASSNFNWWYAFFIFSLLKIAALFKSVIRSSIVGIGCLIRLIVRLASHMSMQRHTPSFFLGGGQQLWGWSMVLDLRPFRWCRAALVRLVHFLHFCRQ